MRRGTEKKTGRGGGIPSLLHRTIFRKITAGADLSVEYLARLVDLSPAYFGKQFYSILRVSCSDYIADVRLENAAKLLRETSLPVQEISERVGWEVSIISTACLRKKIWETPVNYRKKQTKQNF